MGGVRAVLRREDTVTAEDEQARLAARVRKLETEVKDLKVLVGELVVWAKGVDRAQGAH